MARSLQVIAREIRVDWVAQGKQHSNARPYMLAMQTLHEISDSYGADSGKSIVNYFLANAATWHGETARRIKAELKRMVADAG